MLPNWYAGGMHRDFSKATDKVAGYHCRQDEEKGLEDKNNR